MNTLSESFKKIPFAQAIALYKLDFFPSYIHDAYAPEDLILIYNDDVSCESLELDTICQAHGCAGVVFAKDLTAQNHITQVTMDYGPLVVVLGNVHAKNVYVSGGMIYFRVNVKTTQTLVCGVYNHGETHIKGEIHAEVIVSYDHFFDHTEQNIKQGIFIDREIIHSNNNQDIFKKLNESLYNEEDEYFNTDVILSLIQEGKSLLR